MKRCGRCKQIKPVTEFHRSRRLEDGLQRRCKACDLIVQREQRNKYPERMRARLTKWRANNPDAVRIIQQRYDLKRSFGISLEEYEQWLVKQNDGCAICGAKPFSGRAGGRRLAVDHDHETGAVRGLLCGSCNRAVGQFDDNPAWMRQAADYVKEVHPWD